MRLPRQARLCPIPSLYKALTKTTTAKIINETCYMKQLTMSRFSLYWTSSVVIILTDNRKPAIVQDTVCSTCHS